MKTPDFIVSLKAFCYVIIGVFGPWSAALAQWIGTGEWPPKIVWIAVILPASAIGGASQLLAFLSSSWGNYKAEKEETNLQTVNETKL